MFISTHNMENYIDNSLGSSVEEQKPAFWPRVSPWLLSVVLLTRPYAHAHALLWREFTFNIILILGL